VPDFVTYDLDDDNDHVKLKYYDPLPLNLRDATNKDALPILVPKTMTEFAEDIASAQQNLDVSQQRQQRRSPQPQDVNSTYKDIRTLTTVDANNNRVTTLSSSKVPKSSSPVTMTATASRRRSTRGTATSRKRMRKDVSEDEDEDEDDARPSDEEEEEEGYGVSSSSPKKKRTKRTNAAIRGAKSTATKRGKNTPSVAASTRTLRPRTSKKVVVYAENDDDEG
jgi:hypothetical protein